MSDLFFVEDAILARASDETDGLNPMIRQFAQQFGIADPERYVIDFTPASKQLLQGEIDPADLADTSATKYPQFHVWVKGSIDQADEIGSEFSGIITAQVRLLLSWRGGDAMKVQYDKVARCFVAAMGSAFNRNQHGEYASPALPLPFSFMRTPITRSEENWGQGILYTMPFRVTL
ncbi:MAG TPA: hypothetical protein VNH18_17580 [Bryobacteraceae bacterium]|nr:hypothetical protein [Bryobacteraceae bacterium]